MKFKEFWQREKYVALHAQSLRFRLVKYIILVTLAVVLFRWRGGVATLKVFLGLAVLGLGIHFLFRWKTKAWTQPWGPYKKILLDKN
jgi:hypothetical protein